MKVLSNQESQSKKKSFVIMVLLIFTLASVMVLNVNASPIIIDLGKGLKENDSMEIHDINEKGQIVGNSVIEGSTNNFLWDNGTLKNFSIFTEFYHPWTYLYAINDYNQIVGEYLTEDGIWKAFLWENGVVKEIEVPEEVIHSRAYEINNKGQVIGDYTLDNNVCKSYIWENGVMKDLGTLGGINSYANDINNKGQVVGASDTGENNFAHAYIWENGVMKDLNVEVLGATRSIATAINENSQVVGVYTLNGINRAFIWENGVARDLGILDKKQIGVEDINDKGQVVGWYFTGQTEDGSFSCDSFIWENGVVRDLNLSNLEKKYSRANRINNKGQIVGLYYINGDWRSFIWEDVKPTSTPFSTVTPTSTATNIQTNTPTSTPTSTPTPTSILEAKGFIDSPKNNLVITETLKVSGWFLDINGVLKIEVLVDGKVKGEAVYGDKRVDVKKAYPQYNNDNCGYHYMLDTSKLTPGNHKLTIRETNKDGKITTLSERSFKVLSNKVKLKIELVNGKQKKYDLYREGFEKFLNWVDEKSSGNTSVKSYYVFDKGNNKSEYILFDKVLSFEVKGISNNARTNIPIPTLPPTSTNTPTVTPTSPPISTTIPIASYKFSDLTFNGIDDYLKMPNTANIASTNQITISTTVKFNDLSEKEYGKEFQAIALKQNWNEGFGIMVFNGCNYNDNKNKNVTFYHGGLSQYATIYNWPDIDVNRWYNITCTYDGSKARIYIDGVLKQENDVSGTLKVTNGNLYLGKSEGYGYPYFLNGSIKQVNIYDKALSSIEIESMSKTMLEEGNK